jgi:hypothetical protein
MTTDIEQGIVTNEIENHKKNKKCLSISIIICIFIVSLSITICDLFFGFSDDPCLEKKLPEFKFNLKTYLRTSGFISIIYILLYTCYIIHILYNRKITIIENENIYLMVFSIGIILLGWFFILIWTILACILFWNYLYPNHLCNTNLSNYMFVSLIVKIISTYYSLIKINEND